MPKEEQKPIQGMIAELSDELLRRFLTWALRGLHLNARGDPPKAVEGATAEISCRWIVTGRFIMESALWVTIFPLSL